MGFDPAKHKGDIQLLSCYSAFTLTGKEADQSFAQRFARLLRNQDNNYTGTVWGVSGSLNPLHVSKPGVSITTTHLWQSDPTYNRMKEIDTLLVGVSAPFYDIEDYIEGTAQEKPLVDGRQHSAAMLTPRSGLSTLLTTRGTIWLTFRSIKAR